MILACKTAGHAHSLFQKKKKEERDKEKVASIAIQREGHSMYVGRMK